MKVALLIKFLKCDIYKSFDGQSQLTPRKVSLNSIVFLKTFQTKEKHQKENLKFKLPQI